MDASKPVRIHPYALRDARGVLLEDALLVGSFHSGRSREEGEPA
jgi:hypothetical protein